MIEAISAIAGLALVIVQAWLSYAPTREAKRKAAENVQIHNDIASGDVDAVRDRLNRLRAKSS